MPEVVSVDISRCRARQSSLDAADSHESKLLGRPCVADINHMIPGSS